MKKPKNQPLICPVNELRGLVRTVMNGAADHPWTLEAIEIYIKRLTPKLAPAKEIQRAIDWNHDHGFVDFKRNQELEITLWYLTPAGKDATA